MNIETTIPSPLRRLVEFILPHVPQPQKSKFCELAGQVSDSNTEWHIRGIADSLRYKRKIAQLELESYTYVTLLIEIKRAVSSPGFPMTKELEAVLKPRYDTLRRFLDEQKAPEPSEEELRAEVQQGLR